MTTSDASINNITTERTVTNIKQHHQQHLAHKKKKTNSEIDNKPTFVRVYEFADSLNVPPLDIHQDPRGIWSGGIGATVWDAGILMCKYFEAHHETIVQNKVFIEIGSGTGLCGLAAIRLGAHKVLFTDKDCAIPLLNKNLFENVLKNYPILNTSTATTQQTTDEPQPQTPNENDGVPLALAHALSWDNDEQIQLFLQFAMQHEFLVAPDYILISDCICWPELYEPLIRTLQTMVDHIMRRPHQHNQQRKSKSKSKSKSSSDGHNTNDNTKSETVDQKCESESGATSKQLRILMSYEIRNPSKEIQFFQMMDALQWTYEQVSLTDVDPMYLAEELVIYCIKVTPSVPAI